MVSRTNPNKGLIDALSALRSALGADDILTAEQAKSQGYISIDEYASDQQMTYRGASNVLGMGYQQGKLDRVRAKKAYRWCYWYKAKS